MCIFKMSSGFCIIVRLDQCPLVFVTIGLWKNESQKHQSPSNQNQTHLTTTKNNNWGNYYETVI